MDELLGRIVIPLGRMSCCLSPSRGTLPPNVKNAEEGEKIMTTHPFGSALTSSIEWNWCKASLPFVGVEMKI